MRQVICSMNKGEIEIHIETGTYEPIGSSKLIEEIADLAVREE